MLNSRAFVLSVAGFDPSAGAGLLADTKCFEQHRVYGFGICTALTVQTDTDFLDNTWISASQIIAQLEPLLSKFKIAACKIGLIQDMNTLFEVLNYIKSIQPDIKIVLDPVLSATAGFKFHDWQSGFESLVPILKILDLITPNYEEFLHMAGTASEEAVKSWAAFCPVLLKGGHHPTKLGIDQLFSKDKKQELYPSVTGIHQKHGSGCVLSASITANLAMGHTLPEACSLAKRYTEQYLNSNLSLLGYHSI